MSTVKAERIELSQRRIVDDKLVVYLIGGVIGLFLILFMVIPVGNILRLSITKYETASHSFVSGLTLDNFVNYYSKPAVVQSLYNSL